MRKVETRKTLENYVYEGFGFPVTLLNVPMIQVRGEWTPDVDYNEIEKALLREIALKKSRLTGSEVKFVRHSLSMTLEQFATRFGVSHPAVLKWEKSENSGTNMIRAVEKDIRLEVLRSALGFDASMFLEAYSSLIPMPNNKPENLLSIELKQSA